MSEETDRNARFAALADELEADTFVVEDRELRRKGFPQQLIYAFRAAGLSKDFMHALPTPTRTTDGNIQDAYWVQLRNLGVPAHALPQRFQDVSRISANDADARTYANLVMRVQPNPTTPMQRGNRFTFGSPVRPFAGSIVPPNASGGSGATRPVSRVLFTPGTPGASLGAGGSSAPPPATPATPFGSQIPTSHVDYLKHVDFAMPSAEWSRVRNDLLASNTCSVLNVFSINDKQFQLQFASLKVPAALQSVGHANFDVSTWRDVKEYLVHVP